MSSEAARTLVKLVDERGFVVPAPRVLMKLLDLVSGCYATNPVLIHKEYRSISYITHANSIRFMANNTKESSGEEIQVDSGLILFDITSLLLSNKHHPFQHRNNRLLR
jgi:hypothetical protein